MPHNRPIWYKKLREEILDRDSFKTSAAKQFVLVEIGGAAATPERMMQLDAFLVKHDIHDVPAAVLMDAEGRMIANVAYEEGAPEEFLKRLNGLIKTWESVLSWRSELEKLQGSDRVQTLGRLIEAYDRLRAQPKESIDCCREIISLDPSNKSGLKGDCEFRLAQAVFSELIGNRNVVDAVTVLRNARQIRGLAKSDAEKVKKQLEQYEPIVEALEMYTLLSFKAEKAKGLERAKLLDQLIETYSRLGVFASKAQPTPNIDGWSREIVSLDASNQIGLKQKYLFKIEIADAWKCYRENRLDDGRRCCDRAIALSGLTPDQLQEAFSVKGDLYSVQKNDSEALDNYRKALDAAPQGPKAELLKQALSQLKDAEAHDAP